jgi:hypothetical protein
MSLKGEREAAEQRRVSVVDSWHTIHSDTNYLLDHGAFRAASVDQIRSVLANLDDFFVCIRNPQFRVDFPDRVVSVMSVHWPNFESVFDLDDFAHLLSRHSADFRRYLALYRVSVKAAPADVDNFSELSARLDHATVVLSAENHADRVGDLVGALAFALGLAQGAIDRIGRGQPEPLAKKFAELKVRAAQVTDIVQVMERFLCIRDLVRASAGDLFRVMAEQVSVTTDERKTAIKDEKKALERVPKTPQPK